MKFKTIAATLAFATLGTSAFAQTYVGAGVGASHINVTCDDGVDCRYTDVAGKLLVGYALPGTDFALEGSYNRLGTFKENQGDFQLGIQGTSWNLGAAWRPQFGAGWGGVVRAGAAFGTAKTSYSGAVVGATPLPILVNGSESKDSWHPYLGLGATYALTPQVRLAADWDNTRLSASFQGMSATNTVNTFTLGATFGF